MRATSDRVVDVRSGAADESLRFWKIFEQPAKKAGAEGARGLKVSNAFARSGIR